MTGKADAVRAVSQQFNDRTNTVIEGVMAHLRDDNAKEILGLGLSPLIGRGSLKSIVTFALYADVLRMVRDMVMADGEISDGEVKESLGLLSVLAAGFAKVRKEYASFTQLTPETARQFLSQYESDAGLFGHANEATKWAGVALCRNFQDGFGDSTPLEAFGGSLLAWAEAIAACDDLTGSEQRVLETLRTITRSSRPAQAEVDKSTPSKPAGRQVGIDEQSSAANTPEERLFHAVTNHDVDALQAAVEEGADIDHQYHQEGSRTALHLAVLSGNMSLVQWLVLLGADLDACDGQGNSALALARAAGNTWIAEFLQEHGAGGADEDGSQEDDGDDGYSNDDDDDEDESENEDENYDEDDEDEIDPLAKALAFTWGRMVMRADMNEDCSDLVAEARSLIKQGADTTFLKKQAQLLRELKIIP